MDLGKITEFLSEDLMAKNAVQNEALVAVLDVGSTKLTYLIGSVSFSKITIRGAHAIKCKGIKNGAVVDISKVSSSILEAKKIVEEETGLKPSVVWVGVNGEVVSSFSARGVVSVKSEVTNEDLLHVMEEAKSLNVDPDYQVLHSLPIYYQVDSYNRLANPVGMSGRRLEASVFLVTAKFSHIKNITKCVENAGFTVAGFALQSLATSLLTLHKDEKNLGVALLDFGGDTCEISVYKNNVLLFTDHVPVGGRHFTKDIAIGFKTSYESADQLKMSCGVALRELVDLSTTIKVPEVGSSHVKKMKIQSLCDIIEPRAEELLDLIKEKLNEANMLNQLGAGLVITGGSSQLKGFAELMRYHFDCDVRIAGSNFEVLGKQDLVHPALSSALGLVIFSAKQKQGHFYLESESKIFSGVSKKIKDFLSGAL